MIQPQEVKWHTVSVTPSDEDEPGADGLMTLIGDLDYYQCQITPMHQHQRLYRVQVGAWPQKECPVLRNQQLTADQALQWCLSTIERLQEQEPERVQRARQTQEQSRQNVQDAISHIQELVGLPHLKPQG